MNINLVDSEKYNNNRVIVYCFSLYAVLFVVEGANSITSMLFSYTGGKTGNIFSSLFGDAFNVFSAILYDFVFYIAVLMALYLFFAWMNAKIILKTISSITAFFKTPINNYLFILFFLQ